MELDVQPGEPSPLGARWDTRGVNFAVRSALATRVEVCLYDPNDLQRELARFTLPSRSGPVWHGHVTGLSPGTAYGLRVHGPWRPELGQRCNASKLLVDPYARALAGQLRWHDATLGHRAGDDLTLDARDSAPYVPRSLVVDERFDWEGVPRPDTPWRDTLIYELHVRGFTARHPEIPPALRGTYAGLGHPAAIAHLRSLGVTAVELLPVHDFVDDGFLVERGLTNYWGYSTLSFFAPARRYASDPARVVPEFKEMVRALHRAGIEVILDVVYNHTCEGNQHGPTLSLKGIDNPGYYHLSGRGYTDYTGCGNSVAAASPTAQALILDSLRYWARELHVDGFRFDLASELGRDQEGRFRSDAPLFRALAEDPLLSQRKLIAEPWDLGPGGYRVGGFPPPIREWNDRFRDAVRTFWRGDHGAGRELRLRLAGSPDLYFESDRGPLASIDFVTCHDGFTLRDLVSYAHKHNEANQEQNRDGSSHEQSWNRGVEGDSALPDVQRKRLRDQRNMLATLMLGRGVPMLLAGDELGRTQRGNNNAYCQDNALSWLCWELDESQRSLLDFTRRVVQLRERTRGSERRRWYDFAGEELAENERVRLCCFAFTSGELLIAVNGRGKRARLRLPEGRPLRLCLDTAPRRAWTSPRGGEFELGARSLAVFAPEAPGAH